MKLIKLSKWLDDKQPLLTALITDHHAQNATKFLVTMLKIQISKKGGNLLCKYVIKFQWINNYFTPKNNTNVSFMSKYKDSYVHICEEIPLPESYPNAETNKNYFQT